MVRVFALQHGEFWPPKENYGEFYLIPDNRIFEVDACHQPISLTCIHTHGVEPPAARSRGGQGETQEGASK